MIPKWSKHDPKMISKWSQNDPKMIPKRSQNDSKMIPKWFQNDPKMIPKWSQNDPKMIPKWSQCDPNMIPTWAQSDPKSFQKTPLIDRSRCADKFGIGISLWDDFYVEFEHVLSFIINTVIMSVKGSQDKTEMIDLVVLINLSPESASGTFYVSMLSRF